MVTRRLVLGDEPVFEFKGKFIYLINKLNNLLRLVIVVGSKSGYYWFCLKNRKEENHLQSYSTG